MCILNTPTALPDLPCPEQRLVFKTIGRIPGIPKRELCREVRQVLENTCSASRKMYRAMTLHFGLVVFGTGYKSPKSIKDVARILGVSKREVEEIIMCCLDSLATSFRQLYPERKPNQSVFCHTAGEVDAAMDELNGGGPKNPAQFST